MQVKVTLTLKDEELKKIMDNSGLTKPDEIKGYFYAREKRNIECEFGNRYDIDVKVDDIGEGLRRRLDGRTAAQVYIYDKLFNHKDPAGKPGEPGVKEVKRHANVGEWIKIIDGVTSYDGICYYKEGDILKVYKEAYLWNTGVYCELEKKLSNTRIRDGAVSDNGNLVIWDDEYVVLEGYEPPKKPEVKEVKRPAKIGEWIKITDPMLTMGNYKKGDIFKASYLSSPNGYAICVHLDDEHVVSVGNSEYVVLENYEPEEGEKK